MSIPFSTCVQNTSIQYNLSKTFWEIECFISMYLEHLCTGLSVLFFHLFNFFTFHESIFSPIFTLVFFFRFFFGLDDFFCVCVLHTSSICYDRIDLSQQKNSIFYDLIFVFEVIDFGLISVLVKYYLVDFSSQNDLVSFVFFFFFVYRN